MKQTVITTIQVVCFFYVLVCTLAYIFQEKLIFQSIELEQTHKFSFKNEFEEQIFKAPSGASIHSLFFKSKDSKGLIFYLHGNAGSLDTWGHISKLYTMSNYDVLMIDYPSFGKSTGKIDSEQEVLEDVNYVYEQMLKQYARDKIVVIGYSIGSVFASYISSIHNPKLLILQSPFDELATLMKDQYPLLPGFLLNYEFNNVKHLKKSSSKMILFHGKQDELIGYEHSLRIKEQVSNVDTLYLFENHGHNNMNKHKKYVQLVRKELREL